MALKREHPLREFDRSQRSVRMHGNVRQSRRTVAAYARTGKDMDARIHVLGR
jgi:hypothetical protein